MDLITTRPGVRALLARAAAIVLAIIGVLAMHTFSVGHMPALPTAAHHLAAATQSSMTGMAELATTQASPDSCDGDTCLQPAGSSAHGGHGAMVVCVPLLLGAVLLLALLASARARRASRAAVRAAGAGPRRVDRGPPQRRMSLSLSELSLLRV